jgi:uncharacterized protein
MIVYNSSKNVLLADNCAVADTLLKRFIGLMGKKELPNNRGLLIKPCNSIHMFFMKISLDIVFIDNENTVVYLIERIKPWRVSRLVGNACSVLELPEGTIVKSGTNIGDNLIFKTI